MKLLFFKKNKDEMSVLQGKLDGIYKEREKKFSKKLQGEFFRDIKRYNKAVETCGKIDELKWSHPKTQVMEGGRIISLEDAYQHYLPSEIEDRLVLDEPFSNRIDYAKGVVASMEKNIHYAYGHGVYSDVTVSRNTMSNRWAKITKISGYVLGSGTFLAAEALLLSAVGWGYLFMTNSVLSVGGVVPTVAYFLSKYLPDMAGDAVRDKINNRYLAAMETFEKIRKSVRVRETTSGAA
ncbi:Uncharacterised protein [uncultured archaeon]|nr:Uncharacterised protein [uncultured archaeon]